MSLASLRRIEILRDEWFIGTSGSRLTGLVGLSTPCVGVLLAVLLPLSLPGAPIMASMFGGKMLPNQPPGCSDTASCRFDPGRRLGGLPVWWAIHWSCESVLIRLGTSAASL
uniref:Uncharacterized protein n=1 Tax=Anopheles merus TaxID=30066 RepID=A0A182UQ60_ANOME